MKWPWNPPPDGKADGKGKKVSDSLNDRHVGKAMCVHNPEGVTVTFDCTSCGERTIGPLHPLHLRSVAAFIDQMADAIGLPSREQSINHHIAEELKPTTDDVLAEARQKFDQMDMGEIVKRFDGESGDATSHGITSRDIMNLLGGKPDGKVH